ncbi:MAG: DUF4019 domain-containing protein [Gemmatimonadota bacterium]
MPVILAALLVGTGAWQEQAPAQEAAAGEFSEAAVRKAAAGWLELVDAGRSAASWKRASSAFRTGMSREAWTKRVRSIRSQLGELQERNLVSARFARQLPGSPEGEYVVLLYASRFVGYPVATERVIMRRGSDGSWGVAGYFVH